MSADPKTHPSLYRDPAALPDKWRGGVLAIGNFDGVHLGHRQVIANARAHAEKLGCPLGVILFDPHPRQYFAPDAPNFRLTRIVTRARLLDAAGVDFTLALPFDANMASCEAEDFITRILVGGLQAKAVAIGHDFRFGKSRRGDIAMLQDFGAQNGFEVVTTQAVLQPDNETPYSSSAIRQHLREGAPDKAATLLGHDWTIEAEVSTGDRRGHTIGFATANMELDDYLYPAFGVYAVRAQIISGALAGQCFDGVANLGMRPTVGTPRPRLETHLFDFDADIYGQWLSVALLDFIRPEQKFDGLDSLKAQIARDSETARQRLAARADGLPPASGLAKPAAD